MQRRWPVWFKLPSHSPVAARLLSCVGLFVVFCLGAGLFVGCLEMRDNFPWSHPQPVEPPPPTVPDRQIRVLLGSRKPRPSERLSVTTPFVIIDSTTGQRLARVPDPAVEAPVQINTIGGISFGAANFDKPDIIITPDRDAAIALGAKTYRGRLRIVRIEGGLLFINLVDIEGYVRGVLRGELPGDFHPESFKALAVAARTYALYQKRLSSGRDYDVVDHEGSQVYDGVSKEERIAVDAVEATRGRVCVWNNHGIDEIFCTYYSSTCGGCSQAVRNIKPNDPAVPPLAGGVICNDCSQSKFYRWGPVRITKSELTRRIVARYPTVRRLGTINDLRPKGLTPDGRLIRIELIGSTGQNEVLVGEDFRLCLGGKFLRSTNFTIETRPDGFNFKDGKGYGHGVGLCQYGMDTKAKAGMTYEQILATYYPHSKVKKIY